MRGLVFRRDGTGATVTNIVSEEMPGDGNEGRGVVSVWLRCDYAEGED